MSETTLELYRCTVHGGSKDWAIQIADNGHLRTVYGATGQPIRQANIPPSKFAPGRDSSGEMHGRIQEKLAKGYVHLGQATVEKNRLQPMQSNSSQPVAPGDHWEIVTPLDRRQVHEKLAWIEGQLRGHVTPDVIEYDADNVVLVTGTQRAGRMLSWAIGFSDHGGIQDTGRGGGQIVPEQGLLPRLILMVLMRAFPDAIRLSDTADGILTPQISRDDAFIGQKRHDYERVLVLGERLGLCIGRIALLSSESRNGKQAFWF